MSSAPTSPAAARGEQGDPHHCFASVPSKGQVSGGGGKARWGPQLGGRAKVLQAFGKLSL